MSKLRIEPDGEAFAPKAETIKVKVCQPEMKVTSMVFTVKDADGQEVYKEAWKKEVEGAKTNTSPGPPTSFTWDGEDLFADATDDSEGGRIKFYVTPLRAPLKAEVEAEVTAPEQPSQRPQDVPQEEGRMRCRQPAGELVSLTSMGVKVTGGEASESHVLADLATPTTVAADSKKRITIAPGAEEGLEVVWKLSNAGRAREVGTTAKLELFSKNHGKAVWWHSLDATAAAAESLKKADWRGEAPFFDELLRVKDAPYKLKLTIQGMNTEEGKEVAWTYLDVVVGELKLYYGPAAALPAPQGVQDAEFVRKQELLILRELKAIQPALGEVIQPQEGPDDLLRNDQTAWTAGKAAVPADDSVKKIELESNFFYKNFSEGGLGFQFKVHETFWREGPRIPLFAELKLKNAKGELVSAPKALAGLQVLWDWEDPQIDKHSGLESAAFLQRAMEQHGHAGDANGPASTNCPVAFGGKRGGGSHFPSQVGYAGAARDGEFPFRVAPLAERSWAALSSLRPYAEGDPYPSMTGVIFQPSRIAGDTYRVRAYVYTGVPADFQHSVASGTLWTDAETAGVARAQTCKFEVWRLFDIVRYFKRASGASFTPSRLNAKLAPAKLRLRQGDDALAAVDSQSLWTDGLSHVWDQGANGGHAAQYRQLRATLTDSQSGHPHMLRNKAWSDLADAAVIAGLRALQTELTGFSNRNKRDRLQKAETALNDPSNQPAWQHIQRLLPRQELVLLNDRIAKVNAELFPVSLNGGGYSCLLVADNLPKLAVHLAQKGTQGSIDDVMKPLTEWYIGRERSLATMRGLYIYHFDSYFDSGVELAGKACALDRTKGLFVIGYPAADLKLSLLGACTRGGNPTQYTPLVLSTRFGTDRPGDLKAACLILAHQAVAEVVGDLTPAEVTNNAVAGTKAAVALTVKTTNGGVGTDLERKLKALAHDAVPVGKEISGHDETSVYLSLREPFSKVYSKKLSFPSGSDALTDPLKQSVIDFVRDAYAGWLLPITSIFVFHKGSKHGHARAVATQDFIQKLIGIVKARVTVARDQAAEDVYDIDALTAHELGHALFLEHSEPAESNADNARWRHVVYRDDEAGCLMNYTANGGTSNFCGLCLLALRGWDIGSKSAPKFPVSER